MLKGARRVEKWRYVWSLLSLGEILRGYLIVNALLFSSFPLNEEISEGLILASQSFADFLRVALELIELPPGYKDVKLTKKLSLGVFSRLLSRTEGEASCIRASGDEDAARPLQPISSKEMAEPAAKAEISDEAESGCLHRSKRTKGGERHGKRKK